MDRCRQCGNVSDTLDQDQVCANCNQENDEAMRQMESLMDDGHTHHCANRQVWGDGECECSMRRKNAS